MRQRLRQFAQAGAAPGEAELALARAWLDGALLALFLGQHPRDVVHAADTARWLLSRGHSDRELVQAALLHDVAKGEQRRLDRVAFVLLDGAGLAGRAGRAGSRFGWRRALARSAAHSERGAELLLRAGASERVAELTRRHHSPPQGDAMLALLQQADEAS